MKRKHEKNVVHETNKFLEFNFFRKNRQNKSLVKHKNMQQKDIKISHCIFSSMYHEFKFIASFDVLGETHLSRLRIKKYSFDNIK